MKKINLYRVATACILLSFPCLIPAQVSTSFVASTSAVAEEGAGVVAATKPATQDKKPLVDRWLDVKSLSSSFRYRNAFNQGSAHTFEDGQEKMLIETRIKLDAKDRYAVNIRASSGGYFNWSYADVAGWGLARRQRALLLTPSFTVAQNLERHNAGLADLSGNVIIKGTVSTGWHFYMRELYFSAAPLKPVTVEFGSLGIERGFASEITTFDDDGWVSGERVRIKDPKHLYFDEIGYTNAFFGDLATPNVLGSRIELDDGELPSGIREEACHPAACVVGRVYGAVWHAHAAASGASRYVGDQGDRFSAVRGL